VQHVVQTVHQRFLLAVICRSLKRESSRTKSSKRRVAAASSRSANSNSPLDDAAHRNSARCARSPRSENVRIRSGMIASLRTMNAPRARCPLPSPLWGGSTRKARRGGGRSYLCGRWPKHPTPPPNPSPPVEGGPPRGPPPPPCANSPQPVPALERPIAHHRALLVQREERRIGDAAPQRGAVNAERIDLVGVEDQPHVAEPSAEPSAERAADAVCERQHGR